MLLLGFVAKFLSYLSQPYQKAPTQRIDSAMLVTIMQLVPNSISTAQHSLSTGIRIQVSTA